MVMKISRVTCSPGLTNMPERRAARMIDTVWAALSVTQVRWSARERAARSSLKRAAVQPKVDLHREPGVLDRAVQIASAGELDVAADRAQRSAAAKAERAVSFHGAVDWPSERGQA